MPHLHKRAEHCEQGKDVGLLRAVVVLEGLFEGDAVAAQDAHP